MMDIVSERDSTYIQSCYKRVADHLDNIETRTELKFIDVWT